MKKLFLLIGLVVMVSGSISQDVLAKTYKSSATSRWFNFVKDFDLNDVYERKKGFSKGAIGDKIYSARGKSQIEADNRALEKCSKSIYSASSFDIEKGFSNDGGLYEFCYVLNADETKNIDIMVEKIKEHRKVVVLNNIKNEEEKKKIEQKNTQEQELASILQKQKTCETLGFEIGKESNGECVLKLMQMEIDLNKIEEEKTVYVQSGDSNRVAESLARQALRQQEINSSLMLMQQGYNLMKPKPRINCNTTLMGWTCY